MRYSWAIGALATAASVACSPLADIARTSVAIDDARAGLDEGIVSLTVTRIDDLVTDETHQTLLERVSHISLKLTLGDADLLVNGQPVHSLQANAEPATISVVRADALLIPDHLPSSSDITPQQVDELRSRFSKGLVSVEVRVESEVVDGVVAQHDGEAAEGEAIVVQGVGLRRVGVFVKLNEVEGVDLAHSSLVYLPIVQLLIRDSTTGRPHITTLSVNGQTPSSHVMPGPVISAFDAPIEPASVRSKAPMSYLDRIASFFGEGPAEMVKVPAVRPRFGHPCAKHGRVPPMVGVDGEAVERPWASHPHGHRIVDAAELADMGRHFRHAHGHGHGHDRHGFHLSCFLRRVGHVGSMVLASIFSLLVVKLALGLALGLGIARAARRRRGQADEADDEDVDGSEKTEPLFVDEVDELPVYTEKVDVVVEEKPARDGGEVAQ